MRNSVAGVALWLCACAAALAAEAPGGDWLDAYNVAWDTPSKDFHGAIPIGNGDVGASVWLEESGDLLFYISKTDAWDDNARLLKLGRVRVKLTPNPFAGDPLRQELRLRQGEIEIRGGQGESQIALRVWVDANLPVIRVEAEGRRPLDLQAALEVWRTAERVLPPKELSHSDALRGSPAAGPGGKQETVQYPDVVVPDGKDRLVWYHRNARSAWPVTMQLQGLEECMQGAVDPLLGRTFGGCIYGPGLVRQDGGALKSARPAEKQAVSIVVLTRHPATVEEWRKALDTTIAQVAKVDVEAARAAHREWWDKFWNRSWIRVRTPAARAMPVAANTLPLRFGADSTGQTRFAGQMARAGVWSRALTQAEIERLAKARDAAVPDDPALVGNWRFDRAEGGAFANTASGGQPARIVGELPVANGQAAWTGKGYAEVPHDARLDLAKGFTLEAWIKPDAFGAGGARIIDKTAVGTSNGYLLDTFPGNSLRSITAAGTLRHDARLVPGRWVHVAATYDAAGGVHTLYVGGKPVAAARHGAEDDHGLSLTRGYLLQRYFMACGARGGSWVKFNGSIFTLPWEVSDPDFRRWGPAQWFQNARLPYWPMLAAGDYEMMMPFYRTYVDALPMARRRTKIYYGHDGAFFPETLYFWGTYVNADYDWNRKGRPAGFAVNTYIRYYWSGGLELATMMLDYYDHTQDPRFLRAVLLPVASSIVEFYDQHYKRDEKGKVRFEPAQSLETWQVAVNPLPEIAGLRYVLPRLLELPADATTARQRRDWQRLLGELPPVPTTQADGKTVLAAAEKILQGPSNVENPELYAVFPYRLYGVGKSGLEMARETLARRTNRHNVCWWQDDIHMAYLGLADEAGQWVSGRLTNWNKAFRFPATWGPHNDEIPDMDHGGVGQMALQCMILQAEGRKMLLLPAWPKDWDVEFRLHAPMNTVVEGAYRSGKVEWVKVTPESRAKDLVRIPPG